MVMLQQLSLMSVFSIQDRQCQVQWIKCVNYSPLQPHSGLSSLMVAVMHPQNEMFYYYKLTPVNAAATLCDVCIFCS